jgi:hypothetical protein
MKITGVELHPVGSSAVCVLSFRDPGRKNPYNVKAILGLDAEEITPQYYGGPGGSTKFYDLALDSREITAKIGLNPIPGENQTFSSLRDDLYKLISASRTGLIEVQFKNLSVVVASVSGFITKFESPHFEKTQEVQLTIRCDDTMLRAPNPISVNVAPLSPDLTTLVDSLSTAQHGFKFEVIIMDTLPTFAVSDPTDSSWAFTVTPLDGFLPGDHLYFSSERNNKYLYMVRGDTTIQLASAIMPGSIWPTLFPGTNDFSLTPADNVSWVSLSYYPTYWGV